MIIEILISIAAGFLAGVIATYFVARNNQKHLPKAFDVDDTIRAEYLALAAKAKRKAEQLKRNTLNKIK